MTTMNYSCWFSEKQVWCDGCWPPADLNKIVQWQTLASEVNAPGSQSVSCASRIEVDANLVWNACQRVWLIHKQQETRQQPSLISLWKLFWIIILFSCFSAFVFELFVLIWKWKRKYRRSKMWVWMVQPCVRRTALRWAACVPEVRINQALV